MSVEKHVGFCMLFPLHLSQYPCLPGCPGASLTLLCTSAALTSSETLQHSFSNHRGLHCLALAWCCSRAELRCSDLATVSLVCSALTVSKAECEITAISLLKSLIFTLSFFHHSPDFSRNLSQEWDIQTPEGLHLPPRGAGIITAMDSRNYREHPSFSVHSVCFSQKISSTYRSRGLLNQATYLRYTEEGEAQVVC